jgi:tetratricopeptide (TPR) repeat protein
MWRATSCESPAQPGRGPREILLLGVCIFLLLVCHSPLRAAQADLQHAASLIEQGKLQAAETELRRSLSKEPNSEQALHMLGLVYQREGKYRKAEATLYHAVKLAGDRDLQLIFLLAQTEFALKKTKEALALADQVGKLAVNIPAAGYSVGRLLLENGFPREAARELEKSRSLAPTDPAILTELVAAYGNAHEADKAQPLLDLLLSSASYEDLLRAGSRWGEIGHFPTATRAFERALQIRPDSYDARFNLAFALFQTGALDRARASLDSIDRTQAQSHADYHYLRGKIELALQHPQVAAEEYLQAIHLQPDNESLCMDAGLLYSRHEDYEKSLEAFQTCVQRLPDSIPVETGLGLAYFQLGKYSGAIDAFKKVIALRPEADAACEALVFLLYLTGHLEEGRRILEARMRDKDSDYYIYFLHAFVLLRLDARGNQAAALRSLERSLELSPKFAPAYYQRAKIVFERGETANALKDLEVATTLDPNYAQPYSLMAQIYFKLGKRQAAEQAAAKSVALGRETEEKDQRRRLENRLIQSLR